MHVSTCLLPTNLLLYALQASSPSAAQAAAAPAVERSSDGEPMQIHADRHKTYSESELAEMETGVHTKVSFQHVHSA